MPKTSKIVQIAADAPFVYAFRIEGGVSAAEMSEMAETMNAAFDRGETVNMLLILRDFDAADALSGLSARSLESQFRSLRHVERYAVVGAPAFAAAMIETFGKMSPIAAETFDPAEEAAAWAFVGARPAP